MPDPNQPLLTGLLREVSRSFYLTLRVLPQAIRPQIGLAYLLARTTDTIADTGLVPAAERLAALAALRERILGKSQSPLAFGQFEQSQASPAEAVLLRRTEESLQLLAGLGEADRQLVREVLAVIISGQTLDLERFEGGKEGEGVAEGGSVGKMPVARENMGKMPMTQEHRGAAVPGRSTEQMPMTRESMGRMPMTRIVALRTAEELDDYTYRVAGCVGEFWTRLCRAHLFPALPLDFERLLVQGVRFGKGLQLVNILRDMPSDLRQGRCYLPIDELAGAKLSPGDLLDPAVEPRLRPVYNAWLARAEGHLQAGWEYTNTLPRSAWRLRLACAWPVLIGLETLAVLRRENALDPQARRKISRPQVRSVLWRSALRVPFPGAFRRLGPPGPGS